MKQPKQDFEINIESICKKIPVNFTKAFTIVPILKHARRLSSAADNPHQNEYIDNLIGYLIEHIRIISGNEIANIVYTAISPLSDMAVLFFATNGQKVEVSNVNATIQNTLNILGLDEEFISPVNKHIKKLVEYDIGIRLNNEIVYQRLLLFLSSMDAYKEAAEYHAKLKSKKDALDKGVALSTSNTLNKIIESPINILTKSQKLSFSTAVKTTLQMFEEFLGSPLDVNVELFLVHTLLGKDGLGEANQEKVNGYLNSANFLNSAKPLKSTKVIYNSFAINIGLIYSDVANVTNTEKNIDTKRQIDFDEFCGTVNYFFDDYLKINIDFEQIYTNKSFKLDTIFSNAPIYKPITSKTRHADGVSNKQLIEYLDPIFKQD